MEDLQIENGNFTRIVNRTLEELVKVPLLGAELAIVLFVIRKTYGYNKTEDRISLSQFEEGVNRSRPTIVKALKNLQLVNILQLVKRGLSKDESSLWRFNKYYSKWRLVKGCELVKDRVSTSKEKLKKLVKTPLHTKDNTKEKTKDNIPKQVSKGLKEKPVNPDNEPQSLMEYVEKMKASPQRHIQKLGDYAEEIRPPFTTKGQWKVWTQRHVQSAKKLSHFDDDQIDKALTLMEKDIYHPVDNPKGFLHQWTLDTLIGYMDKINKK